MRQHILRRVATFVACALVIASVPTLAGAVPAEAKNQIKRPNKDGSVPSKWDLEKPEVEPHPDEAPAAAGGTGDGVNSLLFGAFDSGDMIVALGTPLGHAGCWDATRYRGSIHDFCVWSANTTPRNGVQLEQPSKYRAYDLAYGLWVPSRYYHGNSVKDYCAAQNGEPYNISSSKINTAEWYCSKLPWKGWQVRAGVDLDADGGYWVWPVDLLNDSETRVFVSSN